MGFLALTGGRFTLKSGVNYFSSSAHNADDANCHAGGAAADCAGARAHAERAEQQAAIVGHAGINHGADAGGAAGDQS